MKKGVVLTMLMFSIVSLFAQENVKNIFFNKVNIFSDNVGLGIEYNSNYHEKFEYSVGIDASVMKNKSIPADFDGWFLEKLNGLVKIQALALYKLGNTRNNYAVIGAGPAFCLFDVKQYSPSTSNGWFASKYDSKTKNMQTIGLQTQAKYLLYIAKNRPLGIGASALLSTVTNVFTITTSIGIAY